MNDDQKILNKEGELIVHVDTNQQPKHWVVLKRNALYCYQSKDNQTKYAYKIILHSYISVSDSKKSAKRFYLKSKTGQRQRFDALSVDDKNEWIEAIRSNLYAETYGVTVKVNEKIESICSIWLFLLCFAIVILFCVGTVLKFTDVQHEIFLHAFCIPLSQYQVALIVLCSYYVYQVGKQVGWNNAVSILSFDKFWVQSFFCFWYNILACALLSLNLIIKLAEKNINNNKAWFFANIAVFLFGAFSIPFPEVCIRMHRQFKYHEPKDSKRQSSAVQHHRQTGKNSLLSMTSCSITDNIEYSSRYDPGSSGVKSWLTEAVRLPEHCDVFVESKINDISIVKTLTEEDLKEMNIQIGDRKRIMYYINKMNFNPRNSVSFNITSINASRPIFRDNITKGVMCICYLVHLLAFVCNPLLSKTAYNDMVGIMYPDYDNEKSTFYMIMYDVNQIFLRNFVCISLISVIFTFLTELTDKQIITTNYYVLWLIWKESKNRCWQFILLFMIFALALEFFALQNLMKNGAVCINGFWTIITICTAVITIHFIFVFSGAYSKTRDKYQRWNSFIAKSPKSPIKIFVMESIVLFVLYLIYILFMILYIANNFEMDGKLWDVTRQTCILILSIFQFFTLIRVKQAQKFPNGLYLERFSKRLPCIVHFYYKLNCILIVYNIIYCFMFQIQYFGSLFDGPKHIYARVAFAFSFSLPGSMLFILSHYIDSYQQWTNDERSVARLLTFDELENTKNPALNDFMSKEHSKHKLSTHSLDASLKKMLI